MAVSGFEGFEKRLELHFTIEDPVTDCTMLGLRVLDFDSLVQVLDSVQCTVVSAVANHFFDAYVLSESSLFVYPTKIIIKTCGTTQLLKSIRPMIHHARNLGLTLCGCRYTRGSFIFPEAQPFPYTNFEQEVLYIEENIPISLCYRKSSIMQSKLPSHTWHVFGASTEENTMGVLVNDMYNVEVCMTELDSVLARKFYKNPNKSGKDMTMISGINSINPRAIICDFAFDPCGYSMNSIDLDRYSTIHVTPEDGFSYASFECVGSINEKGDDDVAEVLKRAVDVFRPAVVTVSITFSSSTTSSEVWKRVEQGMGFLGFKCRSRVMDEFPTAGTVVFQTFTSRRK